MVQFFPSRCRAKLEHRRAKEIGDQVGIMKEGRLVMEWTREELQYEDLVKIYIDYMKSEPLIVH